MSRRRALTDEQELSASEWFHDYERVGTFEQKAKELGVDTETLRDAIKRARGLIPRPLRRKLSEAELNQLLDDIPRGTEVA